ncbi:MAG: hypothetical protein KAG84_08155 [Bacteroidales bacterium]|nr:hypothetical protein [Bacteroidales bacterium]
MKKIKLISIIIALFAISISVKGQSEIGIKIGSGTPYYKSTFNYNVLIEPKSLINYEVFYNKKVDKILKLGASFAYQKHKFNSSWLTLGSGYDTYSNYDYSLGYLFLKLYTQFTFGDKVIFVIQLGPTLSEIISSNEVGTRTIYQSSKIINESYDGEIRYRIVEDGIGVFSYIGIEFKIEKVVVTPSIQYQYSMNSLKAVSSRFTERSVLLNLGISYNFG